MKLPKVFDESFIDSPTRNRCSLPIKISLTKLYKMGYFITELFGTKATVVKHTSYVYHDNVFSCTELHVEFGQNYDETVKHIERIRDEMWEKYKKFF